MAMVHVLAVITAKPGKRAEILAAFNANVPAVHAKHGGIEYGAAVSPRGAPIRIHRSAYLATE